MAMKPTQWIWHNGQLVPWGQATTHVTSHALHYGSSVFEGIRAYATPAGMAVFRLGDHLDRLFESARIYRMESKFDKAQLREACHQAIRDNGLAKGAYLRPIIYRGAGELGVMPGPSVPIDTAIVAIEWGSLLGEASLERGVDVCVSSWQRAAANTFPMMAKAGGNYLNSQLVTMEAHRHGYQEGIALGVDGMLSEGGGENVFVVRKGTLFTPPIGAAILAGITRDTVITLARGLGYEVREQPLPREALYLCEEAFFTGTACEIAPIRSVDGLVVGEGKRGALTKALQEAFFGLFNGRTPDVHGWLDPVAAGDARPARDSQAALA
jgi:branched-chain amino acid aminotransferase